jgi:hypothetical protein
MEFLQDAATHGITYSVCALGLILILSGIGLAKFDRIQATTRTRTWVAGLILLLCGTAGVLLARLGHPSKEQKVAWAPDMGNPPGIQIREPQTALVPWPALKKEVEDRLFGQVEQIPSRSLARVNSLRGRPNKIVEIVDPNGQVIGNIWFGKNPRNNAFNWDGLIRVGVPKEMRNDGIPIVWETFKRYSDGSYVKIRE